MKRLPQVAAVSLLALGLISFGLASCATVFNSTVTITQVVNAAMTDWADMSVRHQTTPEIDAKVKAVHERYRQACSVAEVALEKYKAGASQDSYTNALVAVRAAVNDLLDLITPLLVPAKATELRSQLQTAKTL